MDHDADKEIVVVNLQNLHRRVFSNTDNNIDDDINGYGNDIDDYDDHHD